MNSNYKVKVNSNYLFDIDTDAITKINTSQLNKNEYHLLKNNKAHNVKVVDSNLNLKSYVVEVNGNSYEVQIENDLDQLIADMGFSVGSSKKIDTIKAPMPGLILEIIVKDGQDVTEGENLVILEAMKMENVITSPRDGKIKSIEVQQGDAIDKNALILKFE